MATLRLGIDARGAVAGASQFVSATNTVTAAATSTMSAVKKLAALAGVGISFGWMVKEAMAAESSYKRLEGTLRLVGAATKDNMNILTQYALVTQRKTVYSHEEIESQMTYLSNLGVHTSRLKEATNAAMGLATAYQMDLESAIYLVGKAWNGETAMLRRRGIIIDQVGSAQEKYNRLIEIGTNNLSRVYGATNRTEGALKQLRNEVSDIGEAIGAEFLPVIKDMAVSVKDWLVESQPLIEKWAKLISSSMGYAFDTIYDLVDYMRVDFHASIQVGLDLASDVFRAWGRDLLVILEKIFIDVEANIGTWASRAATMMLDKKKYQKKFADELVVDYVNKGIGHWPGYSVVQEQAAKKADELIQYNIEQGIYEKAFPTKEIQSWDSVFEKIKNSHKTMIEDMKKDVDSLPAAWRDKFSANLSDMEKRNADIEQAYQARLGSKTGVGAQYGTANATQGTNERALMGDLDAQKKIDDMYRNLSDEKKLLGLTQEARLRRVETLKMERIYTDELGLSMDEAAKASIEFDRQMEQLQDLQKLQRLADDIGNAFGGSFEDMAFGAKSAGEAFKAFAMDVAHLVFKMMVTIPIAQALSSTLMSMGLGFSYGGGGTPAPDSVPLQGTSGPYAALGLAFDRGRILPYARGGVIDRPTLFPMANGAGLMGEAGPEAIMPLRRGSDGRLGVSSGGGVVVQNQINIENRSSAPVNAQATKTTFDGKRYITNVILEDMSTNGPISRGLNSRQ